MNDGYIKLYRKIMVSPIYQSAVGMQLWIECLFSATHKDIKIDYCGKEITLERGCFVFGRKEWSKRLHIKQSTLNDWICKLVDRRMIFRHVTQQGKATIYKIVNWDIYQSDNRLSNSKATGKQQVSNTNKNDKNDKNINNIYSNIESIKTDELLKEISQKFRVTEKTALIQREAFCDWCAAKGKSFKNYKAAYTNWVRKSIEFKPDLVVKTTIPKYQAEPENFTPVSPEKLRQIKEKTVELIRSKSL